MKWKTKLIGDVFKISSGGTPSRKKLEYFEDGSIPWVKTGDLKGKFVNKPKEYITEEALSSSSAKVFPEKTVLLAMYGATIGACSILDFEAATNQACAALLPTDECDEVFLYYYLTSIKDEIIKKGVGGAQPNISAGLIKKILIPLPPLTTQKKIAAILDEADKVRQLNKQLIAKYEALTQSLFLDMFGDPVTNPMGWKKVAGAKFYQVKGRVGWKGYKKTDLRDCGPLVLGATHVDKRGNIDLSTPIHLAEEKYLESPEIMIEIFDLIFVQRGNTIGKVGLVSNEIGKATINPVVLILRPYNVNPFFLLHLLLNKSVNQKIVELNSGSAQPMITQKSMNEYELIAPPIDLQNQFASRIQAIEAQKGQAQQALEKSEALFNSLLQRCFGSAQQPLESSNL